MGKSRRANNPLSGDARMTTVPHPAEAKIGDL